MEVIDSLWVALGLATFLFWNEARENKVLRKSLDAVVERAVVSEVIISALMEELNKDKK